MPPGSEPPCVCAPYRSFRAVSCRAGRAQCAAGCGSWAGLPGLHLVQGAQQARRAVLQGLHGGPAAERPCAQAPAHCRHAPALGSPAALCCSAECGSPAGSLAPSCSLGRSALPGASSELEGRELASDSGSGAASCTAESADMLEQLSSPASPASLPWGPCLAPILAHARSGPLRPRPSAHAGPRRSGRRPGRRTRAGWASVAPEPAVGDSSARNQTPAGGGGGGGCGPGSSAGCEPQACS